jgi:hypothetical protein
MICVKIIRKTKPNNYSDFNIYLDLISSVFLVRFRTFGISSDMMVYSGQFNISIYVSVLIHNEQIEQTDRGFQKHNYYFLVVESFILDLLHFIFWPYPAVDIELV